MRTSIPRPHRIELRHSDTAVYGPVDVDGIIRRVTLTRWKISNIEDSHLVTGHDYSNSMLVPITIYLKLTD